MNKKILLFAFILLLISSAFASSKDITLYQGQSTSINSWTITLAAVTSEDSVRILFEDGLYYTINNNGTIQGLYIRVIDAVYDPRQTSGVAELYLRTLWENECSTNEDCDDGNPCTINFCVGNQERKCQQFNITTCGEDDGCCPKDCTYKKDDDCPYYECVNNSMCNDSIQETTDTCVNHVCKHTLITECINQDDVCPNNCFFTHNKEEPLQDLDCHPDNKCIRNSNCDDGNASTTDYCYAFPTIQIKECIFIENITEIKEIEEETIYPDSVPKSPSYSRTTGLCFLKKDRKIENTVPYYCNGFVWKLQKEDGVLCLDNYECVSNKCIDSRCQGKEENIQSKITGSYLKYIVISVIGFILLVYSIFYITVIRKLKKNQK